MMKENEKHGSEWKTGSVCVRLYIGRVGVSKKKTPTTIKKKKKTHGAKWCLNMGGFAEKERKKKKKDSNCDVVNGNIPLKIV